MPKSAVGALPLVALAATVFLLGVHVAQIDAPFDASLGGTTSTYYGLAARNFEAHGLMGLRLRPALFAQPTTQETAYFYYNHPPFPHLVTFPAYHAWGRDERALRIPILALLLITLTAVWLVARRAGSPLGGWWALGLMASTPMVHEYGSMVDAPMFSLAFLVLAYLAFQRHVAKRNLQTLLLWLGVAFLAALTDWFAYFLVPALWAWLLVAPKLPCRRRLAAAAAFPFALGFLTYLSWLCWATGSVHGAMEEIKPLLGVAALESSFDYPAAMARWFRQGWTGALLVPAAVGAVLSFWRRSPLVRGAWILTIAGLLPAVAFRERAALHEFWILQAAPGLALMGAIPATFLREKGLLGPKVGGLLLAVLVAWASHSGWQLRHHYATSLYARMGEDLNRHLDPRDVVLTPQDLSPVAFYCRAPMIPMVRSIEGFRTVIRALAPGMTEVDDLALVWPDFAPKVADMEPVLSLMIDGRKIEYGIGEAALILLNKSRAQDL